MSSIVSKRSRKTKRTRASKTKNVKTDINIHEDTHIEKLNNFLSDREVDHKRDATHFELKEDGKKYNITIEDYSNFIKLYSNVVLNNPEYEMSMVEKVSDTGVSYLLINFDFVHRESKRKYNETIIKKLIETVNDVIIKNFKVKNFELKTYVTEKSEPCQKTKKLYKDGFHVYYPYLPLTLESRYYILDTVKNKLERDSSILSKIGNISEIDKVIDVSIVNDFGIMMIGSGKIGNSKYELTQGYNKDFETIEKPEIEEQIELFSNCQYCIDSPTETRGNKIDRKIEKICNQYNIVKSHNLDNDTLDNDTIDSNVIEQSEYEYADSTTNSDDVKDEEYYRRMESRLSYEEKREVDLAKKIVKIYRRERFTKFKNWRRVGYALYAVNECLYPTFVEFTNRAKKMRDNYDNKTCMDIWNEAPGYENIYSIDAIRQWGRNDNIKKYESILRKSFKREFEKAKNCTHVDLAKLIFCLYRDRYVCVNIKQNKWYEFQDHRWIHVQSGYTLENIISEDVRDMLITFLQSKLSELKGDNYSQDKFKSINKMMENVNKLGNVKFRENIVRACANMFFDPTFESRLDSDEYLVGFDNGIYDLRELTFRDGMPSDCVSKSTGYDFIDDYDINDPIFDTIDKFFSEVHTDPEMKEYVMTFIASIFRGVPDEHVHMWTGGGGNGKSITVDIIKLLIGDYFGILPVTFLTTKKQSSSGPTPELADKAGKRFLAIQEPEHNDTVYVGQMKEISGKDTLYAHAKYGQPFEYRPMFKMVLTCNNLPHIPSDDNGTWRRLRVTPYESEFINGIPKGPKQFVKDVELGEKIRDWTQPLCWLLLTKYYPIFMKGVRGKPYRIKEPALVTKYTNNYRADSDRYLEFIENNFIITNDEEDCETIKGMYELFKEWYTSSRGEKAPPRKDMVTYLKKNKYKMDKVNVYGVKNPY